MRTNTIDATAFRCLQEYTNMVNVYSKLFNKNYDYNIIEYLVELVACDTSKQMRDLHNERMKYINTRIDKHLEKNKSKLGRRLKKMFWMLKLYPSAMMLPHLKVTRRNLLIFPSIIRLILFKIL